MRHKRVVGSTGVLIVAALTIIFVFDGTLSALFVRASAIQRVYGDKILDENGDEVPFEETITYEDNIF